MDLGLEGRTALVAAASSGLGRAIATELSREGARVAICSRSRSRIETAAEEIAAETGGEVVSFKADVTDRDQVRTFVRGTRRTLGAADILVTNAGGPPAASFEEVEDASWYDTYDLTHMSAVWLIREVLPRMKEQSWGRVVTMTSISVKEPIENLVLSNSLRSAVVGMAKTLAREVASDGVTVNVVCPGYIGTARLDDLFADRAAREDATPDAIRAGLESRVPLGRLGEPREVGELVAFLCSERASYLTGNVIQIDGGMYRGVF